MGRKRTNPKYLKYLRGKAGYCGQMLYLTHGNPRGQNGGVFVTDDGRVISVDNIPDAVSRRRKKVLLKAELYKEDYSHKVSEAAFIKVVGEHYPYGLKRYFSGRRHFFEEETFDFLRRSIVYSTKELAEQAFNNGRIIWFKPIRGQVPPVP